MRWTSRHCSSSRRAARESRRAVASRWQQAGGTTLTSASPRMPPRCARTWLRWQRWPPPRPSSCCTTGEPTALEACAAPGLVLCAACRAAAAHLPARRAVCLSTGCHPAPTRPCPACLPPRSWLTWGYLGWQGLAAVYAFFWAAALVQRCSCIAEAASRRQALLACKPTAHAGSTCMVT